MAGIFVTVCNMSITASVVIAIVLILRLFLKRLPGIFSYALWFAVLVRLLVPFTLKTDWGIIPYTDILAEEGTAAGAGGQDTLIEENASEIYREKETVGAAGGAAAAGVSGEKSGAEILEKREERNVTGSTEKSRERNVLAGEMISESGRAANLKILSVLWLAGCAGFAFYGFFSYAVFMRRIREAREEGEDVVISERIGMPFVAGLFRPVIFLPAGLDKEQERFVKAHEKMHIARKDPLIKLVAYSAVCIHWFNPLVWLGFHFMEQDMEISCDEAVLKKLGYENRKAYARTLLALSCKKEYGHRQLAGPMPGCPVAFGEKGVKGRIRNALRCTGIKRWLVMAASVAVPALMVLLLVSGRQAWKININDRESGENDTVSTAAEEKTAIEETDSKAGADRIEAGAGTEASAGTEADAGPDKGAAEPAIPEENDSQTKDHYYVPNTKEEEAASRQETRYLPSERIKDPSRESGASEAEQGKARIKQGKAGEEPVSDDHSVLLRNPSGNYIDMAISYRAPVDYTRISADFGVQTQPAAGEKRFHSGVDLVADEGAQVNAAAEGSVFETGYDPVCGNYVILLHDNGEMTYYSGCAEILVKMDQRVEAGEQIATVGRTGISTGFHLHYALSREGEYIEPEISR